MTHIPRKLRQEDCLEYKLEPQCETPSQEIKFTLTTRTKVNECQTLTILPPRGGSRGGAGVTTALLGHAGHWKHHYTQTYKPPGVGWSVSTSISHKFINQTVSENAKRK